MKILLNVFGFIITVVFCAIIWSAVGFMFYCAFDSESLGGAVMLGGTLLSCISLGLCD